MALRRAPIAPAAATLSGVTALWLARGHSELLGGREAGTWARSRAPRTRQASCSQTSKEAAWGETLAQGSILPCRVELPEPCPYISAHHPMYLSRGRHRTRTRSRPWITDSGSSNRARGSKSVRSEASNAPQQGVQACMLVRRTTETGRLVPVFVARPSVPRFLLRSW